MSVVNMLDAKTRLSSLVDAIETGRESEVIIARNGRPVARLVALESAPTGRRIGIARGKFEIPDDIDKDNEKIGQLFRIGPE